MPELPEVEAARRAIEEHCVGKKIKRALVADDPKVIDAVSPSDFEASLLGKTIVAAHRKGKNMWLQLDSPPFPTFQFGMTGAIYIKGVAVTKYKRQLRGEQAPFLSAYLENYTLHSNHIQWENPAYMPPNPPPVPQPLDNYHLVEADLEDFLERSAVADTDEWPSKYSKVFMELDDGLELSFTDKRRFARVRLLKNPISVPPICELGPDALFEPMTTDEFFNSLSKKKIGIKALLLDQSFISGIGNWIADEVLHQARIHPMQNAASISKESCAALHKCIKEVIEKAVEVGADSSQFPSYWIFHSRERKPGKAFVDGKKIEFINAGGRTSAFVPELQRLTGNQAAIAPVKQPKITKKNKDEDGGDDDDDGPEESEIEDAARCVESKGKNTTKRGGKKPHLKGKNKANDVDSAAAAAAADDDEEEQQQHIRGKKPPAKTKSKEINRDDGDQMKKNRGKRPPTKRKSRDDERDNTSDNDDDDDKKDQKKAIKGKQSNVEKTSRKKVKTSQSGKQLKKKAK